MDKWNLFQRFLVTENAQISIVDFLINAGIIFVLALILEFTYARCAKSLSGRKAFAANFFLIAFTTMLIITIVKSSLALSLGLVGALSIVRFRSAIKEPEELAYLFFSISLGLGLGANQVYIVIAAFAVLMLILWVRFFLSGREESQNLFVTISSIGDQKPQLDIVQSLMRKHFARHQLKRFDEQGKMTEFSFIADIKNSVNLESFRNEMQKTYPEISISFLDSKAY